MKEDIERFKKRWPEAVLVGFVFYAKNVPDGHRHCLGWEVHRLGWPIDLRPECAKASDSKYSVSYDSEPELEVIGNIHQEGKANGN